MSVVVIALNEADNIRRCLGAFPRESEIIFVDSGSTDGTVEIAKSLGAIVFSRPFANYADQKNFAIAKATRPWVLSLDADEEISPMLIESIFKTVMNPSAQAAYRVTRQLVFMGKRMRFGKAIDRPIRLFRLGKANFTGSVHEELVIKEGGLAGEVLPGVLLHYSYRGLEDYFVRFNQLTSMVAQKHLTTQPTYKPNILRHCLRPFYEFTTRYFFRGGFLDGYPGFVYAVLGSFYAFIKYAKLLELHSLSRQAELARRG